MALPAIDPKTPAGNTAALSQQKWQKFLGLIATGGLVRPSMKSLSISRAQIEGFLATDPKHRDAYEGAKLIALKKIWDEETVEDILLDIAMNEKGGYMKEIVADRGLDSRSFAQLISKDPSVKAMYEEARQIQAEVMADDIRKVANDGSNDTYTDDKGRTRVDNDVVQRSRLRVDTMKWVMSKLHHTRFGDRIQQDVSAHIVVDHAERLEAARKRREALNASRDGVKPEK